MRIKLVYWLDYSQEKILKLKNTFLWIFLRTKTFLRTLTQNKLPPSNFSETLNIFFNVQRFSNSLPSIKSRENHAIHDLHRYLQKKLWVIRNPSYSLPLQTFPPCTNFFLPMKHISAVSFGLKRYFHHMINIKFVLAESHIKVSSWGLHQLKWLTFIKS